MFGFSRKQTPDGRPREFAGIVLANDIEAAAHRIAVIINPGFLRDIALGHGLIQRKYGAVELLFEHSATTVLTYGSVAQARLAAAKLLAEGKGWDVDLLEQFAWTGWQREMRSQHPLLASIVVMHGGLAVQEAQLDEWLRGLTLQGISPRGWYDEELRQRYPALFKIWIEAVACLEPDRLSKVFDSGDDRKASSLAALFTDYARDNVVITAEGRVEIDPLFEAPLTAADHEHA